MCCCQKQFYESAAKLEIACVLYARYVCDRQGLLIVWELSQDCCETARPQLGNTVLWWRPVASDSRRPRCASQYAINMLFSRSVTENLFMAYFTTSTAVIIFICPAGAGNATYRTWWPSVCRRWASCLNNPTRLHHRLLVIAHFQTISQDLSIQSIILST